MTGHAEPRWASAPIRKGQFSIPILKILPGPARELLITSSFVVGVYTHFIQAENRTFPCTGDDDTCICDHKSTSSRWQGWLGVQEPLGHQSKVVCLTEDCVLNCSMLRDRSRPLRGLTFMLGRKGPHKQSPMVACMTASLWDQRRLLAEPDVKAFLTNMWGDLCGRRLKVGGAPRTQAEIEQLAYSVGQGPLEDLTNGL